MPLQVYEDPKVLRLQLKIKILAQELAELQGVKSDLEQQIQALQTRHHQELRPLVVELLQLRQNHRRQTESAGAELPPIEPETPPTETEGDESAPPDSLLRLSAATRRALKEMFRRASKLCHPDLVADEFKAEAGVIFIELKSAYEQQDLPHVEEILRMLERGEKLTTRPILSRNKDKLRAEVRYLRRRIEAMRQEIEALKQSNTYRKLVNIDDWDEYFDDLKAELQRKINRLKRKKVPKF